MNNWQRWLKAPHTLWLRRFLFQVHLWMGIGFGLYILVISVSGSAVVLRPQFFQWFVHSSVPSSDSEPLAGAVLESRLSEVYHDYQVRTFSYPATPLTAASSGSSASPYSPSSSRRAVYVVLERDGVEYSRYFDHYAGEDLGSTFPWQVAVMEWLTDLHDNLLMDRKGRMLNGIGGALLLLMVFSGLLIWWQGKAHWKAGLGMRRSGPRGLMWQLHSLLGFWSLVLLFIWGITAVYFAFPAPFDFIIDAFDSDLDDIDRPDGWLLTLIDLHFGRFGGLWGRVSWIILGLLPALMFFTGFLLWWRRVVKPRLRKVRGRQIVSTAEHEQR